MLLLLNTLKRGNLFNLPEIAVYVLESQDSNLEEVARRINLKDFRK